MEIIGMLLLFIILFIVLIKLTNSAEKVGENAGKKIGEKKAEQVLSNFENIAETVIVENMTPKFEGIENYDNLQGKFAMQRQYFFEANLKALAQANVIANMQNLEEPLNSIIIGYQMFIVSSTRIPNNKIYDNLYKEICGGAQLETCTKYLDLFKNYEHQYISNVIFANNILKYIANKDEKDVPGITYLITLLIRKFDSEVKKSIPQIFNSNKENAGDKMKKDEYLITNQYKETFEKLKKIQYERLCIKKEKITNVDMMEMEQEVLILFNLINSLYPKVRNGFINKVLQINESEFNIDFFFSYMRAGAFMTLIDEGKLNPADMSK